MKKKNFLVDTNAASTALGFVLIMGILISAFSIFMATQVPQWTKEREFEHAERVPLDFAELASSIDMAILREDATASGCAVGMMPEDVPIVGVHASGGTLEFNSSSEEFRYMACAPGDVAPDDDATHWWNSTPANFSDVNYTRFQVVTSERGAELALEIGEDYLGGKSGGTEYLAGEFWFNNFVVTNNITLLTSELAIHAMSITIEQGSAIIADGCGFAGGNYDEPGEGDGRGYNSGNSSTGGGGAGYGGVGGQGGNSSYGPGGEGGSTYGSEIEKFYPGSGGAGGSNGATGCTGRQGGAGGGAIFLDAPFIIIAGNISANGEDGGSFGTYPAEESAGGGGGGGSGGCILMRGDNITLTGNLSATGGNGGYGGNARDSGPANGGGGGGGGAGGRIKVFSNLSLPDISTHTNVSGGTGGLGGSGLDCTTGNWNNGSKGSTGENGTPYNYSIPYSPSVFHYATGYLESCVHDTNTSLVCYRNINWSATPEDTSIVMKVRTSINKSMDENYTMSWDECPPVSPGDISDLPSVSDGHRYIQWRAEFITHDLAKTPVLHSVNVSYGYGIPFIVNSSGSIRYHSQYTNLPNFELVYANGATIRSQTEGEFMLNSPPISISISISKEDNITKLKITTINLTGSDKPLSGGFRATIKPHSTSSKLITGGLYFTNLTINITTAYPATWEKWFNETCKKAGLEYGTNPGDYNITRNGSRVQIAFYGDETIPVNIWLKSAEAAIKIEKKLL